VRWAENPAALFDRISRIGMHRFVRDLDNERKVRDESAEAKYTEVMSAI